MMINDLRIKNNKIRNNKSGMKNSRNFELETLNTKQEE